MLQGNITKPWIRFIRVGGWKRIQQKVTKRSYSFQSNLEPGMISPTLHVPEYIQRPDPIQELPLRVKTEKEIEIMRSTCQLAAKILDFACNAAQEGISTDEIDRATHNEIIKHGAYPSPLHYRGFPKSICTSINECVAHGIPDDRKLQFGDVINIDITIFKDGYHGDTSRTLLIGNKEQVNDDLHYNSASRLLEVSHNALLEGIKQCKPGVSTLAIAEMIEAYVEDLNGMQVIPDLVGHGIGTQFHELPYIAHCTHTKNMNHVTLAENMTFTIEPIIKLAGQGSKEIGLWSDEWTIVTLDNTLSSVFEHTIRITSDGAEILTLSHPDAEP